MRTLKDRPGPGAEAVFVALGLSVLYLLLRSSPLVAPGAFSDDGIYLALGKALAEGDGYRSMYAVGEPVHQKYPPGLPVIYAFLWRLGSGLGSVYSGALLLSLLVTSASAGLLWWVARHRLALGVPVALFFVLGPFLLEGSIQYFNLAVSEPWFIALWAAALALFPRAAGPPVSSHSHLPSAIGLGLVVAAAVLFRSQAIVLVPAVLVGFLVVRADRKAILVFSAGALVPVSLWRVWHGRMMARGPVGTQPDEEAYVSWMPEGGLAEAPRMALDLVSYQAATYGVYLPDHVTGVRPVGILLWIAFLGLVVAGAVRLWRRHPDLVLGCGGSAAIVLLWPWAQDRLILTILPVLGLLAGSEFQRWANHRPGWGRWGAVGLCLVALLIGARQVQIRSVPEGGLVELGLEFHPTHYLRSTTRYTVATSSWVLENTDPDETLLAPQPSGIWLHTGRQVVNSAPALPHVGPTIWHEPGRFLAERLVADRPDFVVLPSLRYEIVRDVATLQAACPQALEHLGATDRFARVVFFRVRYDDNCLQEEVLSPVRRRLPE